MSDLVACMGRVLLGALLVVAAGCQRARPVPPPETRTLKTPRLCVALHADLQGVDAFVDEALREVGEESLVRHLQELVDSSLDPEKALRLMALREYVRHRRFMRGYLAVLREWLREDHGHLEVDKSYKQLQFKKHFMNLLVGRTATPPVDGGGRPGEDKEKALWFGIHLLLHDHSEYRKTTVIWAMDKYLPKFNPTYMDDFFLALKTSGMWLDLGSIAMALWLARDEVRRALDQATTASFLSEAILVAELGEEPMDEDLLEEIKPSLLANWPYLPKERRHRFMRLCKNRELVEALMQTSKGM